MQKCNKKTSSLPYLIKEMAIFRLEFSNFAPMQCNVRMTNNLRYIHRQMTPTAYRLT